MATLYPASCSGIEMMRAYLSVVLSSLVDFGRLGNGGTVRNIGISIIVQSCLLIWIGGEKKNLRLARDTSQRIIPMLLYWGVLVSDRTYSLEKVTKIEVMALKSGIFLSTFSCGKYI